MANTLRFEENWEFCFDPGDIGVQNDWPRFKPASGLKKVRVPHLFAHESNPENAFAGFYFKEFHLASDAAGCACFSKTGATR